MTLPKKVREAGEAAEAELQALRDGEQTDPLGGSLPPKEGEGTPPKDDAASTQAAPPDEGTPPADELDWKKEAENAIHKFNVLNGKYTKEVPALHEEIKGLKERLAKYESGETPPADPATTTGDTAAPSVNIPDEIKEMYGDDLPKWVTDVAKAAATDAVKPVADKVDTISETNDQDKGEAFFIAITEAHADWETINGLDAFKSFLAEEIEGLGIERQEIINKAQYEQNPGPIIAQITAFKEKYGQGEQKRLATQETPGDTGGSPPPVDAGSGVKIKESEIAAFYVRASQGAYKKNPKEFKRLEEMIKDATLSGNIIMDVTPPAPA